MYMLQIHQLSKKYQKTLSAFALKSFSLEMPSGEIVALIGESGSGKTTVLRLIAGFEAPDEGTLTIGETLVFAENIWVPVESRNVGMVFHDGALFPHFNVFQNIAFGLYKQKKTVQHQKVQELLQLVGLKGYENRKIYELSAGEMQRISLARALAPNPKLLLLDEPFSNLDGPLKITLREQVRQILKKTQITTLIVTHDKEDALAIADRVVVLKKGETQQIGPSQEIYLQPENKYVGQFFGKTNFFQLKEVEGGYLSPLGFFSSISMTPKPNTLLIRPHDIILSSVEKTSLKGIVRSSIFYGSYQEVVLSLQHFPTEAFLFSLENTFQETLDQGLISELLREQFRQYSHPLSLHSTLEIQEKGKKWLFQDSLYQYYLLVQEKSTAIRVYQNALVIHLENTQNLSNGEEIGIEIQKNKIVFLSS